MPPPDLPPAAHHYYVNYDDSSDEDNTKPFKYDSFEEVEYEASNLKSISTLQSASTVDLILSFLLHELGIRLLKSKEVKEKYYQLKKQNLRAEKVLNDEQIKKVVIKASGKAFITTYGKKEKPSTGNADQISKLIKDFLKDKKSFVQMVNKKEIKNIIPNPEKTLSTFNFEKKYVKDKDTLCDLVIEVLSELDIYTTEKLSEDTKIRNVQAQKRLQQKPYWNISPLKKVIAQRLQLLDSSIAIKTFVTQNETSFSKCLHISSNSFFENLQEELYSGLRNQHIKHNIIRTTLPNVYSVDFNNGKYTPSLFLAYTRLLTRSNMRLIKNSQENNSILGDDEEYLVRTFSFPGINSQIIEEQAISKRTGSRTAYVEMAKVDKSTSYPAFNTIIANIKKYDFTDKDIANWIIQTLNGDGASIFDENKVKKLAIFEKIDLGKFINSITYLLFGTEVARNPASLLVHCMMLELIQENHRGWTWERAFANREMPMSMKDVIDASRWQHLYYTTAFRYSYDKTTTKIARDTQNPILIDLIGKEAKIFKDWLHLKTKGRIALNGSTDALKAFPLLEESCQKWFSISILSSQFTVEQISHLVKVANTAGLLTDDLLKLIGMLKKYPKIKIEALLNAGIKPKTLIEWYSSNRKKLEAFSNENVLNLLNKRLDDINSDYLEEYYTNNGEDQLEQLAIDTLEELDNSSSSASSGEEDSDSAFICNSIIYDNALLNDQNFSYLMLLAKKHFGREGMSKLIDIGSSTEKYNRFLDHRKQYSDEEAIKICLAQELLSPLPPMTDYETEENIENSSFSNLNLENILSKSNIIIFDAQGQQLSPRDEYTQKIQSQLRHYHETGELFETAYNALQTGYTYIFESFEPTPYYTLANMEPEENDQKQLTTSTANINQDAALDLNEKLRAQLDYYNQAGIAFQTLSDYLPSATLLQNFSYESNSLLSLLLMQAFWDSSNKYRY